MSTTSPAITYTRYSPGPRVENNVWIRTLIQNFLRIGFKSLYLNLEYSYSFQKMICLISARFYQQLNDRGIILIERASGNKVDNA